MTILTVPNLEQMNIVRQALLAEGISEDRISVVHLDPDNAVPSGSIQDLGTPDATESVLQASEVGVGQGATIGGAMGAVAMAATLIAAGPISIPVLLGGLALGGVVGAGTGSVAGYAAGAINGADASVLGKEDAKFTAEHRAKAESILHAGGALIHVDDGVLTDASVQKVTVGTQAQML